MQEFLHPEYRFVRLTRGCVYANLCLIYILNTLTMLSFAHVFVVRGVLADWLCVARMKKKKPDAS